MVLCYYASMLDAVVLCWSVCMSA